MREHKHLGETFQLDDSGGAYIKATFGELSGYVGVNLDGTTDRPYIAITCGGTATIDGIPGGSGVVGASVGSLLDSLCQDMIRRRQECEARQAFKPETASEVLHEFVKGLPEG